MLHRNVKLKQCQELTHKMVYLLTRFKNFKTVCQSCHFVKHLKHLVGDTTQFHNQGLPSV